MIHDKLATFCDAATIDTTADTEGICGDYLTSPVDPHFPGDGEPLYLVLRIHTAVTSGLASSTTFYLKSSPEVTLTDGGSSPTTHWQSAAIPKATLVAGYTVGIIALPKDTYQKYWGITTLSDETLTAGKLDAFLTTDPSRWYAHPNAI